MYTPIHHPLSCRKKRSATRAAANASVGAPRNAPRTRAPTRLLSVVAFADQISVAKNPNEEMRKHGRLPMAFPVGIQKKFSSIKARGTYSKTNGQHNPANDPMHSSIEVRLKIFQHEQNSWSEPAECPACDKRECTN